MGFSGFNFGIVYLLVVAFCKALRMKHAELGVSAQGKARRIDLQQLSIPLIQILFVGGT